jgi:hypothetical protein
MFSFSVRSKQQSIFIWTTRCHSSNIRHGNIVQKPHRPQLSFQNLHKKEIMLQTSRHRKVARRLATPEPLVMKIKEQQDKRAEILEQIKRDPWVDRPWDQPLNSFAFHVVESRGYARQEYIPEQITDVYKSVTIPHTSQFVEDERKKQQNSLIEIGLMIFKQFGVRYLRDRYCEWHMYQRWLRFRLEELDIRSTTEISEAEYVTAVQDLYTRMVKFLSTYRDKLFEERVNLEYKKWLSSVKPSYREEKIPKDQHGREQIIILRDGEWVLNLPENSPTQVIKSTMEMVDNWCRLPLSRAEEGASEATEWIQNSCRNSSKIFGLTPEHRGEPSPLKPTFKDGDNESRTEGDASPPERERHDTRKNGEFEQEGSTVIESPENDERLRPVNSTRSTTDDERIPPLPNNEPWLKGWDDMSEVQRTSMYELSHGGNDTYYRPPPHWHDDLNGNFAPGDDLNEHKSPRPVDRNSNTTNNDQQDDAAAPPRYEPHKTGGSEPVDQTETSNSQQAQNGEAGAAPINEGGEEMQKRSIDSRLMIPANGSGNDDDSNPQKNSGILSQGKCKESNSSEKRATPSKGQPDERENTDDPSDNAESLESAVSDVQCIDDVNSETCVMNREMGAPVQISQSDRSPARCDKAQENTIIPAPILPVRQTTPQPPLYSQAAGARNDPHRRVFDDDPAVIKCQDLSVNTDGPWDNDRAGFSISADLPQGAGVAMRSPRRPDPIPEVQAPRRPPIGNPPANMNSWQDRLEGGREGVQARARKARESEKAASQTPSPSFNMYLPGNNGPAIQVQLTPVVAPNQVQPAFDLQRPSGQAMQRQPPQPTPPHSSENLYSTPEASTNEHLRGNTICVSNSDDTLKNVAPIRGQKRPSTTPQNANPHRRPPPPKYGGVPMNQFSSHPGYNGIPQHPQYRAPDRSINEGQAHMHSNIPSRHDPGNHGLMNGFQGPQSMQYSPFTSMTNFNGAPMGGMVPHQMHSQAFGSGYSNMQNHQPRIYATQGFLPNQYAPQNFQQPNPPPMHQETRFDHFQSEFGNNGYMQAHSYQTFHVPSMCGLSNASQHMNQSGTSYWNQANQGAAQQQWVPVAVSAQFPNGRPGVPLELRTVDGIFPGFPQPAGPSPERMDRNLPYGGQTGTQVITLQTGPGNIVLNVPQAYGTSARQLQNASHPQPAVLNGHQANGASAGQNQSDPHPQFTSASLINNQRNGTGAAASRSSNTNVGKFDARPPKRRGRPPKDPAKKAEAQNPSQIQAPAQPQPVPPSPKFPPPDTPEEFRWDQSLFTGPQRIEGTNLTLDASIPMLVEGGSALQECLDPAQQSGVGPAISLDLPPHAVVASTIPVFDHGPTHQMVSALRSKKDEDEREAFGLPPQPNPVRQDETLTPPSQYVNGVDVSNLSNDIEWRLFKALQDEANQN